jgi:RNA polymerase sigma factor for flagellar operon FliA
MDNINIDDLWRRFKKTNDEKDRDAIVKNYMPLVKYLTDKIVSHLPERVKANDREDLYIEGIIGLLEAIDRFEPEKKFKFETFASKRIRGAVIDTLRREDVLPKNVREMAKKIEIAMVTLESELGRPASEEELIKDLGMTNEAFYDILDKMKGISLLSIDSEILNNDGEKFYFEDIIGESDSISLEFEKKEAVDQLAAIIDILDRDERDILEMYYWKEMTLKEIGLVMQVSESRVCQIHTRLILKLRSGFRKIEKGEVN